MDSKDEGRSEKVKGIDQGREENSSNRMEQEEKLQPFEMIERKKAERSEINVLLIIRRTFSVFSQRK